MKIILSPSKTFTNNYLTGTKNPIFLNKTIPLVKILKEMDIKSLENKLSISNKLANEVFQYYQNFDIKYTAIYLYGGQAFKYLKACEIDKNKLENLYVLSPLYGIIKALDNISLYRLDIKDKIIDSSLYDYWYEDINNYLNQVNEPIINLSSGEFSRLLDLDNLNIITINFGIINEGKIVQQSMLIKKMRGMMANYLLTNEILSVEEIKNVNLDGFKYDKTNSTDKLLMFTK